MNILNLAFTDEQGAGIVTRNTNDGFIKAGHNSVLVVKESELSNDNVIVLSRPPAKYSLHWFYLKIINKVRNIYRRFDPIEREVKYYFHNLSEPTVHVNASKILGNTPFKPDIICLFWISNFVNSKTINELYKMTEAKMFWLMTDNAPMTGGCHYPWNCEGFHTDCSDCPALLNPSKKKIAQKNLAFKKRYLPGSLQIITSSESDFRRASKASVFKGKTIHKLVAPINEEKFLPGNKQSARSHFGIGGEKKVFFYGAHDLKDTRKGGQLFLDALAMLSKRYEDETISTDNFLVLAAGGIGPEFFEGIKFPVKTVGYLNEEDLIRAYQASDFFVCSSVEDSGPLMINQSIMCGTPVVAFSTGAAMDLVINDETGYCARLFDVADLATGIYRMLDSNDVEIARMASNARTLGIKNFSMEVYAKKLLGFIRN
jgi:glycosyltransferase involved in cell wall biosynthesis